MAEKTEGLTQYTAQRCRSEAEKSISDDILGRYCHNLKKNITPLEN